jgi:hypothetical protein
MKGKCTRESALGSRNLKLHARSCRGFIVVKRIGDGSLSYDVPFQKKGWLGLFGPCKPRVLANGFNSSDIVCDSATDLNLSPVPDCLGRFTPPLRIREPDQSEARKVPWFSLGYHTLLRSSTFCLCYKRSLLTPRVTYRLCNPMFCFMRNTCCTAFLDGLAVGRL